MKDITLDIYDTTHPYCATPDLFTLAEGLDDLDIPVRATRHGISVAGHEAYSVTQIEDFKNLEDLPFVELTIDSEGFVRYADTPIETVESLLHRLKHD